jgi:hypothetical protein
MCTVLLSLGVNPITVKYIIYIQYYIKVNVKVKFTLEEATKAQKWSRGIAPLFL